MSNASAVATTNPYTELLNQILANLLPKLNGSIGGEIRSHGLDPYPNVASGSMSFGIGKASYSVNDLTGLSSIDVRDMKVSNVTGSGTKISGDLALFAKMQSDLATRISGDVKIFFSDPGISGSAELTGATISGYATFTASVDGGKICLNQVNITSADFNYSNANINIDGAGILNDILKPLENFILDLVKNDIRSLISREVKGVLNGEVGKVLPQCTSIG